MSQDMVICFNWHVPQVNQRRFLIAGLEHFGRWTLVISLRSLASESVQIREQTLGADFKDVIYCLQGREKWKGQGLLAPCLLCSGWLEPFSNCVITALSCFPPSLITILNFAINSFVSRKQQTIEVKGTQACDEVSNGSETKRVHICACALCG